MHSSAGGLPRFGCTHALRVAATRPVAAWHVAGQEQETGVEALPGRVADAARAITWAAWDCLATALSGGGELLLCRPRLCRGVRATLAGGRPHIPASARALRARLLAVHLRRRQWLLWHLLRSLCMLLLLLRRGFRVLLRRGVHGFFLAVGAA